MSRPMALLLGAVVFICAASIALLNEDMGDAFTPAVSGARRGNPTVKPAEEASLVEPAAVQSTRTGGVSGEAVLAEGVAGRVAWTVRFECSVLEPKGAPRRRLDVVLGGPVDGPGVVFQGLARQAGERPHFEFEVSAAPDALEGATLFVATTKRPLLHRQGRPFRWRQNFDHYRLGQAQLDRARVDRDEHTVDLGKIVLAPPAMLGSVMLGENQRPMDELVVWTHPTGASRRALHLDISSVQREVMFAAFVSGGTWGAGDELPELGAELTPHHQQSASVGTNIYLYHPTGLLYVSVNLAALPEARSILIREAAGIVPAALTETELQDRAAGLGNGVTTLSDKVVGRGLEEEFPVGATTLPVGDYAVEAWSRPNEVGLTSLVASKTVKLGVGKNRVTLR